MVNQQPTPRSRDNSEDDDARSWRSRLAAIPVHRWARWAIIVIWLAAVAVSAPFASKLSGVEQNGATAFLPDSADSAQVARLQARFNNQDTQTAIIVYRRDAGLTADDRAKIEQDRQAIAQQVPQDPVAPAVPSQDGKAALVPVTIPDAENRVSDDVGTIRDITHANVPDGLRAKVTGPAGFTVDLVDVFSGINGLVLGAAAIVVAVLLLITYRSPFVWLVPLITVALADRAATAVVYGLVKVLGASADGQSVGILPVLVFGAGTDYALLLISRYREELRQHERATAAMIVALRQAGPSIIASAGTVTIGLLCLLAAELNSNRSLGPIGATGIVMALLAMLTVLPAVLVIVGRRIFWPFVPRYGAEADEAHSLWGRVGARVARGPRRVWVSMTVILVIFALGVFGINTNLAQSDQFRSRPESIQGQELLVQSFPAGESAPTTVIANAAAADAVQQAIRGVGNVVNVQEGGRAGRGDLVLFDVTLNTAPQSQASSTTIQQLRDALDAVPNANALVGGSDAEAYDVRTSNHRDRLVVIPMVLLVVLVILCLLLRSILAPVLLIVSVVLSYLASLGASIFIFAHLFHFPAIDPSVPLLGFVFLVALGVDYNIFLMGRVHEESAEMGTHRGMLHGLSVTGGVITSAGIVLAATFAVLGVLPLVTLAQVGFLVAFGVLLDTLFVRSVLVPALVLDIGPRIWWPSRLAREDGHTARQHVAPAAGGGPVAAGDGER